MIKSQNKRRKNIMLNYNLLNSSYLKEALPKEKQHKYFILANQGDQHAKEILLEHNLRLVSYLIHRYYQDFDEENKKELFSVGCLELWRCIEKFNINLKNEFSTYAIPSILGSIKRYLRENKQLHIPRSLLDLSTDILNFEKEQNNIQISTYELSKIFKVNEEDIILAKNANQPVQSLHSPIIESDNSKVTLGETIEDQEFEIYKNLEKKELYQEIIQTLDKLPDKQKKAIILLFGLDGKERKQEEVGKILNVTQATVSRMKKSALKKLKTLLPNYIQEEYNQKTYYISKK